MRFIFTKNRLPLSWLIRKLTGEDCSHVVAVFDEKFVIQSNLKGVGLSWFNTFIKKNTIVHQIIYDVGLEKEEEIYQGLLDVYDERGYDFLNLFYSAYRFLLLRLFNKPLPKNNHWDAKNKFLCVDLIYCLPDWLTRLPENEYPPMITPKGLYELMLKNQREKLGAF